MSSKNLVLVIIYLFTSVALGFSHSHHGRIYGGELAKAGQFPYAASLQQYVEDTGYQGHYCGVCILNNQWIATSAFCIESQDVKNYQILAGTTRLDTGGVLYNVTKIILHPLFDPDMIRGDIALMKIESEFRFSDTIASIEIGEVLGYESATNVGWGYTEVEENLNELMFENVVVLSNDVCVTLAQGSYWIGNFPPQPSNVCTISPEGQGFCYGDAGSPLVYNNTLIGLSSYRLDVGCASKYPDVYTRLSSYKDWIESTILEN